MTHLVDLGLCGTLITSRGMEFVGRLPQLEELDVSMTARR